MATPQQDADALRKAKGHVLAIVNEATGEYKPVSSDVVQVIRCKDCKFSSPNQVYGCRINSFANDLDKRMYSDDFCSRAERKEDGTESD